MTFKGFSVNLLLEKRYSGGGGGGAAAASKEKEMNWTGIPKSRVAGALVLVLTTFALYSNTLLNGFVYDDVHQILKNPWITDPGYLPVIFTSSLGEFLPGVA